jgi:hypothetical protein
MNKLRAKIVLAAIGFAAFSCNTITPQAVVDSAIQTHGGDKYAHSTIEFDFRDRHYLIQTDVGKFRYERILRDSTSTTRDILTNEGLVREINNVRQALPDSMIRKYTGSINSVVYFAQLPFRLNDPAVNKKLLGTTTLDGKPYYKIEVTFGENGGGDGFRDVFHFWIHQTDFTLDYFAYYYEENKEWESRFRKVLRRQVVNGIMLQDYINYKTAQRKVPFDSLESLYVSGKLVELSRIILDNAVVR